MKTQDNEVRNVVNEIVTEPVKTKRKHGDLFLLILIVLLVSATLIGLSVTKRQQELLLADTSSVNMGTDAGSDIPDYVRDGYEMLESGMLRDKNGQEMLLGTYHDTVNGVTSTISKIDENGETVNYHADGTPWSEEEYAGDIFRHSVSFEPNEDGDYVITYRDGSTKTLCGDNVGYKGVTWDLDAELGTMPASTDDEIDRIVEAANSAQTQIAYAGDGSRTVSDLGGYFTIGQGGYKDSGSYNGNGCSCSCGRNSSASATDYLYMNINGGTWYYAISKGYRGNISVGTYGTYSGAGWNSTYQYRWYRSCSCSAPDKKNASASNSTTVSGCWLRFYNYISVAPSFSSGNSAGNVKWAGSRKFSATYTSNMGIGWIYFTYPYSGGSASNESHGYGSVSSGVNSSMTMSTNNAATGTGSAWARSYTYYDTGSTSYTALNMKIDNGKPVISGLSMEMYKNNSWQAASSLQNATVNSFRVKITVYDAPGSGASAGVYTLTLKNTNTGGTYSFTTNNSNYWGGSISTNNFSSYSGAFYQPASGNSATGTLYMNVTGADAVGNWTCNATDYAGNAAAQQTMKFVNWDGVAPTVTSSSITLANSSDKLFTNSVDYTNKPLKVSVVCADTTGAKLQDVAAVSTVKITFTIQSTSKTITLSGTQSASTTFTYSSLLYNWDAIKAMNSSGWSITLTDKAGNSRTVTNTPSTVSAKIDTVAPTITSLAWATSSYTNKDLVLTCKVKDYAYNEKESTVGLTYLNNGAGIKRLLFFKDSACTQPFPIWTSSGSDGSSPTQGSPTNAITVSSSTCTTAEKTVYAVIKYDSTRTEFAGQVYVVAEDYARNRSDGKEAAADAATVTGSAHGTTGETYPNLPSSYTGTSGRGTFYLSQNVKQITGGKRDTFSPQVVVKDSGGNIIAASLDSVSTTRNYTYTWSTAASVSFTVYYYYGCSGGTVYHGAGTTQGTDYTSIAATTATSGGTTVDFGGSGVTGSGDSRSKSSTGALSYSKWYSASKTVTVSAEGSTTIPVYIKSGTSPATQSNQCNITVRLDRTAPTVSLLGFRKYENGVATSSNYTSYNYTETQLKNVNQWIYPANSSGYYAVLRVTDGNEANSSLSSGLIASGGSANVDNNQRKYGVNGTASTQNRINSTFTKMDGTTYSLSGSVGGAWEQKYNDGAGHVYSYVNGITPTYAGTVSGAKLYLVNLAFFSRTTMSSWSTGGYNMYNSSDDTWNVTEGTYLRYKIGICDFVGNIGYANNTVTAPTPNSSVDSSVGTASEWNNQVLRFTVDPFQAAIKSVTFWQVSSSDYSDGVINSYSSASAWNKMSSYTMTETQSTGWTNKYVIAEVTSYSGLSGYDLYYKYKNVTYNSDGAANNLVSALSDTSLAEDTTSAVGGTFLKKTSNKKIRWLVLSNNETKNIQLAIGITTKYVRDDAGKPVLGVAGSNGTRFIVKQDVDKPIIEQVIITSAKVNPTTTEGRNSILLTFNATNTGTKAAPNYTFTLATSASASPAYVSGGTYIFTDARAYVFIKVTDKTGSLKGSGVNSVAFGSDTCTKQATVEDSDYYVTANTYGYNKVGTSGLATYSIVVIDKQSNRVGGGTVSGINYGTVTYGHSDTNGYRVLPVVDANNSYVKLASSASNPTYVVSTTEYDKDINNGTGTPIMKLKGTALNTSTFNLTVNYGVGISGIKLFVRRKTTDFTADYSQTTGRLSGLTYYTAGGKLAANYDYSGNGWGYYSGENWISGSPAASWNSPGADDTGVRSSSFTISFNLSSLKKNLEILVVSGTRHYYVIDLGGLFIDTEAPKMHTGMTTFAISNSVSSADTVNYESARIIWTNEVGMEYTDANVYTYFFVTDPASGLNESLVKCGSTVLTKVTMTNVPVYKVNNVPVTVRALWNTSSLSFSNVAGQLYINGYPCYLLGGDHEPVAYVASPTVTTSKETVAFYRASTAITTQNGKKVVSPASFTLSATDNAGNNYTATKVYTPNVDPEAITVGVMAKTDRSDSVTPQYAAYGDYTGEKFTNEDVLLRFQAEYGASGFDRFEYSVTLASGTTSSYTISIPLFRAENGRRIIYYRNSSGVLTRADIGAVNSAVSLTVSSNYFAIGGSTTVGGVANAIPVSQYGNLNAIKNFTFTIYNGYLYAVLRVSKANLTNTYAITGYSNISAAYASTSTQPSDSTGFAVKIDIDRPSITLSNLSSTVTANYPAIAASVTDNLSGVAKTNKKISSTEYLANVYVSYNNGTSNVQKYMIPTTIGTGSATRYVAYNTTASGQNYSKDSVFYATRSTTYTVYAFDEAGNETQVAIELRVDDKPASVESVNFYLGNTDTPYFYNAPSVSWIMSAANGGVKTNTNYNWATDYIRAEIVVKYGDYGYSLQKAASTSYSATHDVSSAWSEIDPSAYTVTGTTINAGYHYDTITYKISENSTYHFNYYKFRALSQGQKLDLARSGNEVGLRAAEAIVDGVKIIRYSSTSQDTFMRQYMAEQETIAVDQGEFADLVAIDKVTPSLSISMTAGENSYGSVDSSTAIKVGENDWSTDAVTMSVDFNYTGNVGGIKYPSGNVVFFSTSTNGTSWSDWMLYDPYDKLCYTFNSSTNKWVKANGEGDGMQSNVVTQKIDNDYAGGNDMAYLNRFQYTLSTSQNNVLYKFYVQTGSGLCSDEYYFGTYDSGTKKVYGIKIDRLQSTTTVTAVDTYNGVGLTTSSAQSALIAEYNTAARSGNAYSVQATTGYTSKNAVIVRVAIQSVGYSGVDVTIYRRDGNEDRVAFSYAISYADFVSEAGTTGTIYRYYLVNSNGRTINTVKSKSVMGNQVKGIDATNNYAYVNIDYATPIVYVKSIVGTKATNWGWMNNLYAKGIPEYWYVSNPTIEFGVGLVEDGEFLNKESYSGFTIEYQADGGSWQPLPSNTPKTLQLTAATYSTISNSRYKYRITSGAGISYELGSNIQNNQGATVSNITANGVAKTEIADAVAAVTGITPVTGHVINNTVGTGDYDDGKYNFVFNVDSNTYSYSYVGQLLVKVDGDNEIYDTDTNKFVTYHTYVATGLDQFGDPVFELTTGTSFHRGDIIKIEYTSKYNGVENGTADFNYFQNKTVSTATTFDSDTSSYVASRTITHNEVNDWYNLLPNDSTKKRLEREGSVSVQFEGGRISIVSYFLAEVDVTYGQDEFYAQTSSDWQTTGTSAYFYMDGSTLKNIDVSLGFNYFVKGTNAPISVTTRSNTASVTANGVVYSKDYQYNTYRLPIGAYYVQSVVTGGLAFRVSGATANKDFIVKYFEEDENGVFHIYDENDFYFINATYYELQADGTVDPVAKSYLDGSFVLESMLTLGATQTSASKTWRETITYEFKDDRDRDILDERGAKVKVTYPKVEQEFVAEWATGTTTAHVFGTFTGTFDGNGHGIILMGQNNNRIAGDYGFFENVNGVVKNVALYYFSDLMIDTTTASEIGLFAKEIGSSAVIDNVAVTANVTINNMVDGSYFGGLVAVSNGGHIEREDAESTGNVFTDIRITNNGRAIEGEVAISALIGYMKQNTVLKNVYVFGEIELYNVSNSVYAGMVYGKAQSGSYETADVVYFDNNVFINGNTLTDMVSNADAITTPTFSNPFDAADYSEFVTSTTLTSAGLNVRNWVLTRLYNDFGYQYFFADNLDMGDFTNYPQWAMLLVANEFEEEYTVSAAYGLGTTTSPLVISTKNHLMAINGYMNLSFVFASKVTIDMAAYKTTLAVTKVFNGELYANGNFYVTFTDFGGNTSTLEETYFGLFGQLNGRVEGFAFTGIALDMTYEGTEDVYVGLVAANAYEDATIKNVILVGTENITATQATAYVGGVVGYARDSFVTDVFSMNNLNVNASVLYLGGIAAKADGITLPRDTDGSIFLLGRAVGNGVSPTVGSVIGTLSGDVTGGEKVYSVTGNVYVGSNVINVMPVGSTNDTFGMVTEKYGNNAEMKSKTFTNGQTISRIFAAGYYPVDGEGDSSSPFIIRTEQDFKNINLALYAVYRVDGIDGGIRFTNFETIGQGAVFTGELTGNAGDDISAENGKIISLSNVTAPLVYYNSGSISELSVSVEYDAVVGENETFKYGAIAVINDGKIKNVTVSGSVNITSETEDTTLYVSGFVAESLGGVVEGEASRLQNSISALDITINGGGTAYVGGYAGLVTRGTPSFSYGIATGSITVTGVKTTHAGLLVGMSNGECTWVLGEAASIDYTYTIIVNGVELDKYDNEGNPKVDNFCGIVFR